MNREVLSKYPVMTVGKPLRDRGRRRALHRFRPQRAADGVPVRAHGRRRLRRWRDRQWSDRRFNLVDLKKVLTHWQEGLHGRGWNSCTGTTTTSRAPSPRFGNDSPEYRTVSAKMLGTVLHLMRAPLHLPG